LNPYNYKLDIIYEDDDLLVINKSAGISIHPGAGNYDNTIVNALMNYCGGNLSTIGDELRPGIVHRIDKDTSGLIVIAKNNNAHENLSNQFKKHTIKRVYQVLIWGKLRPQSGKIETLITRSSKNRQLMEVGISKGKMAITNYKTLEIFENDKTPTFSFIECLLETGRTHQIRVHMSYKGNNILGDKKYKKKFKKFKNIDEELEKSILKLDRQFLHAKVLGFRHPSTGKELEFSSILPQELENMLKKLRNTDK
jgi:23S rRNA pseudouridine1911/1915/1917 synthase